MLPQLHTPAYKIKKGYTPGQEYIIVASQDEYIGFFHTYPNGAIYSGDTFTRGSLQLERVTRSFFASRSNLIYRQLSKLEFYNHLDPVFYIAKPTAKEIETGVMTRFICQKRNEPQRIMEIDRTQATNSNAQNRKGIDLNLWNIVSIEWTIRGKQEHVRTVNDRVLAFMERKMPGLRNYLFDSLEFYQQ